MRFSTKDKKWIEKRQRGWREFRESAGIDEAEEEMIWSKVISSTKVRIPKKSPYKAITGKKPILKPSILSLEKEFEIDGANEINTDKSDRVKESESVVNALNVNVIPQLESKSEKKALKNEHY